MWTKTPKHGSSEVNEPSEIVIHSALDFVFFYPAELQMEIERLKSQGGSGDDVENEVMKASKQEIASLKEKLAYKEREMAEMTK